MQQIALLETIVTEKIRLLWSQNKSDEYITLAAKEDDGAEARWIGEKIFTLLVKVKKREKMSILYRANNQSRALEIALRELIFPIRSLVDLLSLKKRGERFSRIL